MDTPSLTTNAPKILVIKPSSLGDIVHTLPAVALLKKRWPLAQIQWITNPEWAPILQENPCVDEPILFPRNEFRGALGFFKALRWAKNSLRKIDADLILDFQGLLRSALIACAARKKNAPILGLSDAREGARFFYDFVAQTEPNSHAIQRYLQLVALLGIAIPKFGEPLEFPLPDFANHQLSSEFAISEPFIALHPFSRGKNKSLAEADVQTLCERLVPRKIVLLGKSEREISTPPNVVNLLNQTSLAQLIAILQRADFVVSVDSGPMHIAAAITDRLLGIHTWSDPRLVGPYRADAWIWKGGRILRVREITPELSETSRNFTAQDIPALAEFIAAQTR